MKKVIYLLTFLFFTFLGNAQDYYFPPVFGNTWETISPEDAGWCTENLDTLYSYLAEKNTKAFIVLKDGKIVTEQYFDNFTQDSAWYWASAAKTLTGFLVGIAQEQGLLNIDDKTSDYLGTGWTSLVPEKEALITIKNQLAMSTGLDDGVANSNCQEPSCLQYLADAGDRWSYHNAPYRLLQEVVTEASGQTFQNFTVQNISTKIGMTGLWIDTVFFSKARSMARFGSLVLQQGNWNGTAVLSDTDFMTDMVNTSQAHNQSYGYLWWLNGKGSYMLPQSQIVFNEDLIPNAPADMYAALGKNDQKLYIVPSQNLVVVRMGESSGISLLALSTFDNELWGLLSTVLCETSSGASTVIENESGLFPNPVNELLYFSEELVGQVQQVKIFDGFGQLVKSEILRSNQVSVASLTSGNYVFQGLTKEGEVVIVSRFLKM